MANADTVNWRDGRSLAGRLQHMMEKQHRWDVSLRTEEDDQPVIKAHQLILVAGSPYFEDMFDEKAVKKEDVICLKDIKYSVLKQVIRYLYYEDMELTSGCVIEVFKAAIKFQIPQLISTCETFIIESMSVDNVCDILSFSIECSKTDLRDKCIDFISENANNLFNSSGFLRLSQAALTKVLDSDYLKGMSEVDVFKACMKWADHACQRKGLEKTDENRRNVLGEAIFQIRFANFTDKQFVEITEGSVLLRPTEQLMFYRCFAGSKELPETTRFSTRKRTSSKEDSMQACRMIDTLKVEVLVGDITKETTDAIINSSDKDFAFRGGQSKALLKAGGESIAKECQKISKPVEQLAVTNAGMLKVKHIIHAVTTDKTTNWAAVINACLQRAESMSLKAISIPALGTGVMKLSSKEMAPTILQAVHKYQQKDKPKNLRHVRVIVFQKEMFGDFARALQSL